MSINKQNEIKDHVKYPQIHVDNLPKYGKDLNGPIYVLFIFIFSIVFLLVYIIRDRIILTSKITSDNSVQNNKNDSEKADKEAKATRRRKQKADQEATATRMKQEEQMQIRSTQLKDKEEGNQKIMAAIADANNKRRTGAKEQFGKFKTMGNNIIRRAREAEKNTKNTMDNIGKTLNVKMQASKEKAVGPIKSIEHDVKKAKEKLK